MLSAALWLLSWLLSSVALSAEHRINSASDLIALSKSVSNGTDFSGTTVLLDSDIDFSGEQYEQFEPIGNFTNETNCYGFSGSFDGQGHIIRNLKVNSSSFMLATGLFGFSVGTTIRNTVIDRSCSFFGTQIYEETSSFIGSAMGFCFAVNKSCIFENIVNMADVTFERDAPEGAFVGGIIGCLYSTNYASTLKNCVNYGSIAYHGITRGIGFGGIVGASLGFQSTIYIQNCMNHGNITYDGNTENIFFGGIVSMSQYTVVENCVNSGAISSNQTSEYLGGICGFLNSSEITHCYWTNGLNAYGFNDSSIEVNVSKSSSVLLNQTILDELNRYAADKGENWSKWVALNPSGESIGNATQDSFIGISSALPTMIKEGNTFLFWCKDPECTERFDPTKDGNGGTDPLYPGWLVNVVSFNVNEGNELSEPTKTVRFNSTYGELPTPNRTGYMFLGWFDSLNRSVMNTTIVSIARNHTLCAKWGEPTKYVEIVFETKDIDEEKIEKIVKQFVDEEFTIVKIEDGEAGVKVIIKFVDPNQAKNFVDVVNAASNTKGLIRRVGYISGESVISLSVGLCPGALFGFFLI